MLCSWPKAGRPTNKTLSRRSSSIVPSTLRSGRAPRGSSPSSATSTVTVPFTADGIDADDLARDEAAAGIDRGDLADGQVARLRFRDAQFRLQAGRIRDAHQVGAGLHLLADFDRHLLEHAGHAGADAQLIDLLAAKVVVRAALIDQRLRRLQLRARRSLRTPSADPSQSVLRVLSDSARTTDCFRIRFETSPSFARPSFISRSVWAFS